MLKPVQNHSILDLETGFRNLPIQLPYFMFEGSKVQENFSLLAELHFI